MIQQKLNGGSVPSAVKYEPEMIMAFIQQAVNRKLKLEHLSVQLPSGETIPDGLVLATYDNIPVSRYKDTLSRAQLPAIPVNLIRNMGIYFVGPAVEAPVATVGIQSENVDPGYVDEDTMFPFVVSRSGNINGLVQCAYVVTGTTGSPATADDFVGDVFPSGVVEFGDQVTDIEINIPVKGGLTGTTRQFTVTITSVSPDGTDLDNDACNGIITIP